MLGQNGCRVVKGLSVFGYDALILENRWLSVWILPGKGSDVVQFLYKPQDVDFTWSTVWGLRPETPGAGFQDQYEGGWQEIFPNGGIPSLYRGASLNQHDEVARLPWTWEIVEENADQIRVRLSVDLVKTPFRLEKILTLTEGPSLLIEETAVNLSPFDQEAMWGHHLAFGPPFLTPQCRIETEARTVIIADEMISPRKYRPGRYAWPMAIGADGKPCDLSYVPGPDGDRDIVYLTDFKQGGYQIVNPTLNMGLSVSWDAEVLPYCWYWQECGADGYPWYGRHYNIGLEPFAGYPTHGVAEATKNGSTLKFSAHAMRSLAVLIEVVSTDTMG